MHIKFSAYYFKSHMAVMDTGGCIDFHNSFWNGVCPKLINISLCGWLHQYELCIVFYVYCDIFYWWNLFEITMTLLVNLYNISGTFKISKSAAAWW